MSSPGAFYCNYCAKKNDWPLSKNKCECHCQVCGNDRLCNFNEKINLKKQLHEKRKNSSMSLLQKGT